MSKKKIGYLIGAVVVILFGYLNYFKDEKRLDDTQQVIETKNVTYENEDYLVEASLQKDYVKEKEVSFEMAKAKINDLEISGDSVFLDKLKNLTLKNNILGISPKGWKFEAQDMEYNKLKDEVSSTTGVVATNEKEKIKISGQNFTTDSKMSYIKLRDNVTLENNTVILTGDKGDYDEVTKIVTLADNIKVGGVKEDSKIDGNFKTLKYNSQTRVLEAWEPYNLVYNGGKVSAKSLYYKDDTQELKIKDDVKLEINGFIFDVASLNKEPNSDILNINGKISGGNGVYSIVAQRGTFNVKTGILEVVEELKGTSTKGEKIFGDKLVYDSNTKIATLSGKNGVTYSSKDGVLESDVLVYDGEKRTLSSSGKYTFKGDRYESAGQNFYYDSLKKDVKITKGYLVDKEDSRRIEGDEIAYNQITKDSVVSGSATTGDSRYVIKSDSINYTGENKSVIIKGKYSITSKDGKTLFKGEDATYSEESGELLSRGDVSLANSGYTAYGKDLTYNSKTGLGNLASKVEIVNTKDKIKIVGDKFSFKNQDNITLEGNVHFESDKMIFDTASAKFKQNEEKIYIPEKITFKSKDGNIDGNMKSGIYYTQKSKFEGLEFVGRDRENKLSSKKMTYFPKEEKSFLEGSVEVTNTDSKFRGEKVEYFTKNQLVKAITPYKIDYKEFVFKGNNGEFNNRLGTLMGNGSDITNSNGDRFTSNRVSGNLKEMIIDFTGNVKGKTNDKGVTTTFNGENARVYFKNSGRYEVLRSEIRKNAVFVQNDKKVESDYIEILADRKLIFTKDNTKLTIEDSKNGKTTVTSKVAEIDTNTDIATLIGDVTIKNENTEQGIINVRADRGVVRQKSNTLELVGNVEIENNDSKIKADRGNYDILSKKIKAMGNVFVDYKK